MKELSVDHRNRWRREGRRTGGGRWERLAVSAALVGTALFAAGHVWAIFANGRHGVRTGPGAGATGWGDVLPNVVVVVLCAAAVLLLVRAPRLPAPRAVGGLWVGVPLLVPTGAMPYGRFDDDRGHVTTAWAEWPGTVVDRWFPLGGVIFAAALDPRLLHRDRRGAAIPGPRSLHPGSGPGAEAGRGGTA